MYRSKNRGREEVCRNGLPALTRTDRGFDGVSYEIMINGFPETYRFWMRLPEYWASMKKVIDVCVDYAKIDKRVYKCGVTRGGELTEREQQIFDLRFGLSDGKRRSLEEVGKIQNVSRERIRQVEAKALRIGLGKYMAEERSE